MWNKILKTLINKMEIQRGGVEVKLPPPPNLNHLKSLPKIGLNKLILCSIVLKTVKLLTLLNLEIESWLLLLLW